MNVSIAKAFGRDLRRLSKSDSVDAIVALELFLENPKARELNFERVRSKDGYFTIRANYSSRILLRRLALDHYEAVAVGNHDYVYASYFKKR